jgi:serine O-acetyltransferase
MQLRDVMQQAMQHDPGIARAICADIQAVQERDPAVKCCLVPLLFLKGVHAAVCVASCCVAVEAGRELVAVYLQNRISEVFAVDIHPAARIGRGILMDHATSIVIGKRP